MIKISYPNAYGIPISFTVPNNTHITIEHIEEPVDDKITITCFSAIAGLCPVEIIKVEEKDLMEKIQETLKKYNRIEIFRAWAFQKNS